MKLFVKSAHTMSLWFHSIDIVRRNIMKRAAELTVEPTVAIEALRPKMMPRVISPPSPLKNISYMHPTMPMGFVDLGCDHESGDDVVDHSKDLFNQLTKEDQHILSSCLHDGFCTEDVRRSVTLTVKPSLTIGALKSVLKPHPWIPKENLQIVQHEEMALADDNATLDECGVKDKDTLLTCMGGSFKIRIHNYYQMSYFSVDVSSCFETIGDVKEKIYRETGNPPEDQQLYDGKLVLDRSASPLVALGICRPYLSENIKPGLLLVVPKETPEGEFMG